MPTPAKTSKRELVGIARALVEAGGAEALTIAAVAQAAGVKGPSLYKHFADRRALLMAVEYGILGELAEVLRNGTAGVSPRERLFSMARAYRAFAKANPPRYGLLYRSDTFNDPELTEACRQVALPLFDELERAGIAAEAIHPLARTVVGFLHGFVSIEIVGAFRLGGDLDADFEQSLATILRDVG